MREDSNKDLAPAADDVDALRADIEETRGEIGKVASQARLPGTQASRQQAGPDTQIERDARDVLTERARDAANSAARTPGD